MKEKIDSEKIIRHIKYTRHWLDKANSDFAEKRFSTGGMILNLARAEITAALEEALMLKSRVTARLPARRPLVKWGVASSISLLASGFIIAVLYIQFTTRPITVPGGIKTVAPRVVVHKSAPAASPAAPAVEKAVAPAAPEKSAVASPRTVPYKRHTSTSPAAFAPAPAPSSASEPAETLQSADAIPEPAPVIAPPPATTINQSEIIDLYKTAKKALGD